MRKFIDFHVKHSVEDTEGLKRILELMVELGFSAVTLTFSVKDERRKIEESKDLCLRAGLDMVSRVDLNPKSPRELLEALRSVRRRFEIVAVLCSSKAVARQAAKDRRVDVLNFPVEPSKRAMLSFDRAEANLASQAFAAYEVNFSDVFRLRGVKRAKLVSIISREVETAKKFGIPIIISSGAETIYEVKSPRDLASISALIGLDQKTSLEAVSKTPLSIVERNREKLSQSYVAPGVKVVRRF